MLQKHEWKIDKSGVTMSHENEAECELISRVRASSWLDIQAVHHGDSGYRS